MTRLWLVRHGPTHAKTMLGHTDRPADLSDTDALARLSAALPRVAIVSSDLSRTRATADAIQDGRPRLPDEPAFREFHYGAWEDRPFERIDGPLLRAFFDRPGDVRPPGGESWHDVLARVTAALDRYARHDDLIVVCHFGVILCLWAEAARIPPNDAVAQGVRPLSLTRIDWGADPLAHSVDAVP
ncbi:histidine phosphatase family protein [Jannaschia sp. LMIT008]|uniref:histidine phosphatase family protein n=1 Tax=Jannaschia maritima TaxID=3032585 RepID=UPI002811A55A|nr:histidine phosphatase family protein [Jannaschia sp. LMIT008]